MGYSPTLAIATAVYELLVATWAFRGGGERRILRLTALILGLLATYQVLEVLICSNPTAAGMLPRMAFITVTWLPPLGLVLIAWLHRPHLRSFHASATVMLAAAAGIVVWIAVDQTFATVSVCSTVYARYIHETPRFTIYALFYWVGLLAMMLFSGYGMLSSDDAHRRNLLQQVFLGTAGFVLPSIAVSYFVPSTRGALPSVMCHFALILALFLTRMIYLERRPTEAEQRPQIAQTE